MSEQTIYGREMWCSACKRETLHYCAAVHRDYLSWRCACGNLTQSDRRA